MIATADLSVRAPNGQQVANIEVKNRMRLTPEVAIELRRNIVEERPTDPGMYFLLVSQDVAYLWTDADGPWLDSRPSFSWPMQDVITRLYDPPSDGRLHGTELEQIIVHWLNVLASGQIDLPDDVRAPMEESGFLDAILGSTIWSNSRW